MSIGAAGCHGARKGEVKAGTGAISAEPTTLEVAGDEGRAGGSTDVVTKSESGGSKHLECQELPVFE